MKDDENSTFCINPERKFLYFHAGLRLLCQLPFVLRHAQCACMCMHVCWHECVRVCEDSEERMFPGESLGHLSD